MERPVDLRLHKLKLARSRATAMNPVDLPTVVEIDMEIQRIENGRKPQRLDPVTQAFIRTIRSQYRGKDLNGRSLFNRNDDSWK